MGVVLLTGIVVIMLSTLGATVFSMEGLTMSPYKRPGNNGHFTYIYLKTVGENR